MYGGGGRWDMLKGLDKIKPKKKTVDSPPHKIHSPQIIISYLLLHLFKSSIRFAAGPCDIWQCRVISLSSHRQRQLHSEQSQEEEETRRCYSLSSTSMAKR